MSQRDKILNLIPDRVRLYARRRIAWLRKLWEEEGNPGGPLAITHAEINSVLDNHDSPYKEYEWYADNPMLNSLNAEIERVETAIAEDNDSRYSALLRTFKLSREESDLLHLCVAVKLDPTLGRLYAYLQDHAGRGYATEDLAARLFGYGHACIWRKDAPLAQWEMILEKEGAHGEPAMLTCDPFIIQWLQGSDVMDESIAGMARLVPVTKPFRNWPVKKTTGWISLIRKTGAIPVRIILTGSQGIGRHSFAAVVCDQMDMQLLAIDSDRAGNWPHVFLHAQRQALLNHAGIAWFGEKAMEQTWPQLPLTSWLQFMICDPGQKPKPVPEIIDYPVDMPDQPMDLKDRLVREFIPVSKGWDRFKRDILLTQHKLNIGDIMALKERQVATPEEAMEVIRELSRNKLGTLAQLLECPFGWADLVIPGLLKDSLEDFEFEAKARKRFWEQENARKLFPQGRGLIGLFSGPPGTGKTMAAQVIAAELGLDLYRIDLSSVVSKYVGETSQNLERILSRAAHMDIVLLFDEADALFGKRTEVKDAHDRFANTDTNYLLQAIENYKGIAILATNRKENIDTAFIRRLRYVLEFPKPDARQREQIWMMILAKLLKEENLHRLNGQITALANQLEMTGAQIKFAVLSAVFASERDKKQLEMSHLVRGIERELMKEGRTLTGREREILMAHA